MVMQATWLSILKQQFFGVGRNEITSQKALNSIFYTQKLENCWESLVALALLKVNGIVMKRWVTTGYRDDLSIV